MKRKSDQTALPDLIVINKPQIIHKLHRFELSFIFILYLCDRNNSIFANKKGSSDISSDTAVV